MDIKQQLRELTDPDRDVMDGSVEGELATLARIRRAADELIEAQVQSARSLDLSWEIIGTALGTSRQAAQQRFR